MRTMRATTTKTGPTNIVELNASEFYSSVTGLKFPCRGPDLVGFDAHLDKVFDLTLKLLFMSDNFCSAEKNYKIQLKLNTSQFSPGKNTK